MLKWITMGVTAALLAAAPAWAQDSAGESGAGVISVPDLDNIANCVTLFEGLAVLYVLPKGWEGAEQGVDRQTGKLDEELKRYVLLSRSPQRDDNGAPHLVFELSIYRQALPVEWDASLSAAERAEMEQAAFWEFIDAQLAVHAEQGWELDMPQDSIAAKPYGTGARPSTYFVPVHYEREGKIKLYTFTSVAAGKVWSLKFLVQAEQDENYQALIAFILNNSFAMSEAKFAEYQEQYGQAVPPRPAD